MCLGSRMTQLRILFPRPVPIRENNPGFPSPASSRAIAKFGRKVIGRVKQGPRNQLPFRRNAYRVQELRSHPQ